MENGRKICLGAIVGVHGIKGEVKVKSFTETDRNLERYEIGRASCRERVSAWV